MRIALLFLPFICSCTFIAKDPQIVENAAKLGVEIVEDVEK